MAERFKCVLLFGAPGVGKGTQGKLLASISGFYHCATGDLFRQIDRHTELGKLFYSYSSRGQLVPDDVTVKIWREAIGAHIVLGHYRPHDQILVLDGIPRTPRQAELMDPWIDVLKILDMTCDDQEVMIGRLRRRALEENRHDDADDRVIRNRWQVYENQTRPLLAHYPDALIAVVNATGSPAQVLKAILCQLAPLQIDHFPLSPKGP